jgi:putative hydroxymethylpyrimidine transport system substrate-binding protein
VEGGHFARAGLDVRLVAPADPNDPPRLVAARQGDVAISYQRALHQAVDQGVPLMRIGTLVPTPLTTLTVLRDGPVRQLADLRGRRVGYSVAGSEEIVLAGMLESVGLRLADVRLTNVGFALSSALMSGQVDAIVGGFRNFELNQLDIEGRPGRAFFPEDHGVPVFEELIYVAHNGIAQDRARQAVLRRFLDASAAATEALLADPDAAWALFIRGRRELDDELNRRAWRDTLPKFTRTPAALDTERYRQFADYLVRRGQIRRAPPVAQYAMELPPA